LLASDGTGAVRTLATEAPVMILIGPEGGLSPEERDLAASRGYAAVRFGPRTLRSETAPLAVLAALQALYGDC
jgi:16S rRNA (uracil1498-N3)-methyltransferase